MKHFTATAFVVRGDATLLHWHRRLGQWMPPGGHIEPDEEPAEAALREVMEETGLVCEIVPTGPQPHGLPYPQQLPAPYTILLENIPGPDGPHQHIDFIYFVQPLVDGHIHVGDPTLRWVTVLELRDGGPLDVVGCGVSAAVPEDVRQLALVAIDHVGRAR
ncbi:MAG TPA: NUDIX domain-containing protein [Dehalococcoidia bacterium]|nr:NUDIX domain-containing protein [Dehalococcoidia bacterium]